MHARQLAFSALILTGAAIVVPIFVLVGTVAAFYLIPLLVLAAPFVYVRHRRRIVEVASSTRCTACGQMLDAAAMKLAEEWFRRAARDTRNSRIQNVDAICYQCGAWYVLNTERNRLIPTGRPPGVHA